MRTLWRSKSRYVRGVCGVDDLRFYHLLSYPVSISSSWFGLLSRFTDDREWTILQANTVLEF